MRIQQEAQGLLPGGKLAFGQRGEEIRTDVQAAFQATGLAKALFFAERLKAHERKLSAGDDDFLAIASLSDEAGEVGFCVMDLNRGHVS